MNLVNSRLFFEGLVNNRLILVYLSYSKDSIKVNRSQLGLIELFRVDQTFDGILPNRCRIKLFYSSNRRKHLCQLSQIRKLICPTRFKMTGSFKL